MKQNPYQTPAPQTNAIKEDGESATVRYLKLVRYFILPAIWVGMVPGAIFSVVTTSRLGLVFGIGSAFVFALATPAILLFAGLRKRRKR